MTAPVASEKRLHVAVVGSGAAGLTAAWLLSGRHDVTLFEGASKPGGHVHTVRVPEGEDAGTAIDTGFIVFNDRNYPCFNRLLDRLDVRWRLGDMSFGYACEQTGLEYAGTSFSGLFAQRRNLPRLRHWALLAGIVRFARAGRRALRTGGLNGISLGEFLDSEGVSEAVRRHYVLPMGAAIWSSTRDDIRAFPAEMFLRFFDNHGLLDVRDRPRWRTVAGGSQTYVRRLLARFDGTLRLGDPVAGIRRHDEGGARIEVEGEDPLHVDRVVVATHADQALRLLRDPSDDERALLGAWRYSRNRTYLHTDASVMPSRRRAWASWNYRRLAGSGSDDPVAVTYHMNRLQRLETTREYFVTLNPPRVPAGVIEEVLYTHPVYDAASVSTRPRLPELNGQRHTWFCGAYFGNGFHEDAVSSAARVASGFGIDL